MMHLAMVVGAGLEGHANGILRARLLAISRVCLLPHESPTLLLLGEASPLRTRERVMRKFLARHALFEILALLFMFMLLLLRRLLFLCACSGCRGRRSARCCSPSPVFGSLLGSLFPAAALFVAAAAALFVAARFVVVAALAALALLGPFFALLALSTIHGRTQFGEIFLHLLGVAFLCSGVCVDLGLGLGNDLAHTVDGLLGDADRVAASGMCWADFVFSSSDQGRVNIVLQHAVVWVIQIVAPVFIDLHHLSHIPLVSAHPLGLNPSLLLEAFQMSHAPCLHADVGAAVRILHAVGPVRIRRGDGGPVPHRCIATPQSLNSVSRSEKFCFARLAIFRHVAGGRATRGHAPAAKRLLERCLEPRLALQQRALLGGREHDDAAGELVVSAGARLDDGAALLMVFVLLLVVVRRRPQVAGQLRQGGRLVVEVVARLPEAARMLLMIYGYIMCRLVQEPVVRVVMRVVMVAL
mmetsp:Transcript_51769/g.168253  ORF Transcript_51769/g.168253 Transcript_51769/m.168253 type:complete len:470 (+) Transcript_51769:2447-3856(+)